MFPSSSAPSLLFPVTCYNLQPQTHCVVISCHRGACGCFILFIFVSSRKCFLFPLSLVLCWALIFPSFSHLFFILEHRYYYFTLPSFHISLILALSLLLWLLGSVHSSKLNPWNISRFIPVAVNTLWMSSHMSLLSRLSSSMTETRHLTPQLTTR